MPTTGVGVHLELVTDEGRDNNTGHGGLQQTTDQETVATSAQNKEKNGATQLIYGRRLCLWLWGWPRARLEFLQEPWPQTTVHRAAKKQNKKREEEHRTGQPLLQPNPAMN